MWPSVGLDEVVPHDDGGCPHRFVGSCVGQSNGAFSSVVCAASDSAVVRAASDSAVVRAASATLRAAAAIERVSMIPTWV
jgi:hypothetical protein